MSSPVKHAIESVLDIAHSPRRLASFKPSVRILRQSFRVIGVDGPLPIASISCESILFRNRRVRSLVLVFGFRI
jgi:hypothetical protein